MQIAPHLFLVLIDKAAQYKKRNYTGSLFNPEQYRDFKYNLQYGTIVQIGKHAGAEFPEAAIGDLLLFHHDVEHKPRVEGDKLFYDPYLIQRLPDGNEWRFVGTEYQTYGVFKPSEGRIVPFRDQIFCHELLRDADIHTSKTGRKLVNSYQESLASQQTRLADLQQQRQVLKDSGLFTKFQVLMATPTENMDRKARKRHDAELHITAYRIEDLISKMKALEKECKQLTNKINETTYDELTVLYINPETIKEWGVNVEAGDNIIARRDMGYPLNIQDTNFTLCRPDFVALVKKGDEYFAVKDTVVVKTAPKLTVTKSGLIIPSMVKQVPTQGVIAFAGSGQFKAGEEVVFNKKAVVEIEMNGEVYILLKQRDILYAISDEYISLQEDWVTVLLEDQKTSRLILPESTKPPAAWGKVVHTGPQSHAVSPGLRVCFDRKDGKKVEVKGEMQIMIRDRNIMGYFEK